MAKHLILQRETGRAFRRPMPDEVLAFAKDDGMLWTKNEWGIENTIQADGLYTRPQLLIPNAGAATASAVGIVAPTLTAHTTNDDANGPWHLLSTTNISGNAAGFVSGFTQFRPGWYPRMRAKIEVPATFTSVRFAIGFFSATPDTVPFPGTLHGAWFRYDTTSHGTAFWRTATAAGGAANELATTTAVTAGQEYLLGIDMVPPDPYVRGQQPVRIVFSIATGLTEGIVNVHTTTLPAANQALGYSVRVVTLSGAIRTLRWGRLGFISP